ncbi:CBS domain-containing protein [Parafrankia sp. EUN1f]|uniref:CBS domain-containing protein n=1 Tax=Parafrankia sp. EUN1f TaxID=102897 RepID=UPI0001C43A75|nr:CBS domain-containing protein [Parafrankia sp. EUN1f]EFC84229.1 CBS domain containing protein [Parafrankia sp. EUN1f]
MATAVAGVMTRQPTIVRPDETLAEAARATRETEAGDVLVVDVRAVRRLPVVEGTQPVGIISLGDLAFTRDEETGPSAPAQCWSGRASPGCWAQRPCPAPTRRTCSLRRSSARHGIR